MTTRASNIHFLLSGFTSPTTGEPVENGTVEFYASGTTTQKYVWTEKEKTNGYYTYDLNAVGAANLFGEGEYKIIIKASDGSTVATLDPVRLEQPYYGIRTATAGSVTMVTQDNLILCNTSGGPITINCLAAASWLYPLKIMRIAGTSAITVTPNGDETIDGGATLSITSDAIVEVISDGSNLRSAGFRSEVSDADNDTKIVFDEVLDEDIIRFYASGSNVVYMQEGWDAVGGVEQPVIYASGEVRIQHGNVILDDDKVFVGMGLGDTENEQCKLQVYESGPYCIYISSGLSVYGGIYADGTDISDSRYMLVDSEDVTSAVSSVTFTGLVAGKRYIAEYEMLWESAATNSIALRFGNSGGVDTGNNYSWCTQWFDSSGVTAYASAGHNYAYIQQGSYFDSAIFCVGTLEFSTKVGDATIVSGLSRMSNQNTNDFCTATFQYNGASTVDRIQILLNSGTFTGRIRLYSTN